MTKREELAAQFLAAMLGNPAMRHPDSNPCVVRELAFDEADAFLAACEPDAATEPDAVWTLEQHEEDDGRDPAILSGGDGVGKFHRCGAVGDIEAVRLLAGRERVRLRVYVEEVEA